MASWSSLFHHHVETSFASHGVDRFTGEVTDNGTCHRSTILARRYPGHDTNQRRATYGKRNATTKSGTRST